jgi:hypothetical protein
VALDRVAVVTSTVCTPETDASFCSRLAKNCGSVTAPDNCGTTRTVSSCGTCASGSTCNIGVCAGSAANLFANPTFAGGTSYWSTRILVPASFSTDTVAQDGDGHSAKATLASAGGGWGDFQIRQVRVATGESYTMTAWFQLAEAGTRSIVLFCMEDVVPFTNFGVKYCSSSSTSTWTQCTHTCTPPAGTQARFGIGLGESGIDVRIDNMSLTAGSTGTCTPESDATFCTRLGKNCGTVSGTDNCGSARTVTSCGTCTSPATCGGAGTANVCGGAPSGDTAQYNFETSAQSWVRSSAAPGMITSVAQSTDRAYAGTGALKVNCSGHGVGDVAVASPTGAAGKTVSFRVWVPSGSNITGVQPYVMHTNWNWLGNYKAISTLTLNAWNTITLAVPAGVTVQEMGVELETSTTNWTGAVYVDSVSW